MAIMTCLRGRRNIMFGTWVSWRNPDADKIFFLFFNSLSTFLTLLSIANTKSKICHPSVPYWQSYDWFNVCVTCLWQPLLHNFSTHLEGNLKYPNSLFLLTQHCFLQLRVLHEWAYAHFNYCNCHVKYMFWNHRQIINQLKI